MLEFETRTLFRDTSRAHREEANAHWLCGNETGMCFLGKHGWSARTSRVAMPLHALTKIQEWPRLRHSGRNIHWDKPVAPKAFVFAGGAQPMAL